MYLQIEDPSEAPVPPQEVRIRSVELDTHPDGRRVRMMIVLTPFQAPPNLSVEVLDGREREVSSLSVIGATEQKMSLTVHIRDSEAQSPLSFSIQVAYEEHGTVDHLKKKLSIARDGNNG